MKKLLTLVLSLVLGMSMLAFAGCETGNDKPVAALICLHGDSSTYDKNFIDAFKQACANKNLSSDQYTIVTDIPEGEACYNKAAEFADAGYKVVFADSFGHEDYMLKAAKEFTDVQFCHATGVQAHTANQANFHNAFASIYEGRYLAGIAAGMKLKAMEEAGDIDSSDYVDGSNYKIGYVGAFTYAEVISGYTSFYLGVKSVMSNVVMDVKFTGSWYNEQGEKDTANALIDGGCVLISQHADSMGAPSACETAGIPNVSYNGSTATACPNTFIVSSRINWIPYFEYMLDGVLNNKTIATDWCGTIENGAVVLTTLGTAAAAGTQAAIDAAKVKFADKTLSVFDCSKFTVTVGESLNTNATVDAEGHLTAYNADVDGDYVGDTNVVSNGIFVESGSAFRSAPYFDLTIDGITLLNVNFG